jgi:excisionase family DNA binding protein
MKRKKTLEKEMEQFVAQINDSQDFVKTERRVNELYTKVVEIKEFLSQYESLHDLKATMEMFEQQRWLLKEFLTLDEVAAYLNVSRTAVRTMSSRGTFPVYKPVNKIFVKKDDLLKWLSQQRRMSKEELQENARRMIEDMKKRRAERIVKIANKKNK